MTASGLVAMTASATTVATAVEAAVSRQRSFAGSRDFVRGKERVSHAEEGVRERRDATRRGRRSRREEPRAAMGLSVSQVGLN